MSQDERVPTADERAASLLGRLKGILDPDVRVTYLRHELGQLQPVELADFFTVVVSGAEAHEVGYADLLLASSVALSAPTLDELRVAAAQTAEQRGQCDVASLLRPQREGDQNGAGLTVPDFGRGRALTLGERKSLARTRDRGLVSRVLRDPHPDVIRVLLSNPVLTEDDVVRLCATRPIRGAVLREVFGTTRWVYRYRVRRAMVRNPHCPLDIAVQLGLQLTSLDAREVAESPELRDELRAACARNLGETTLH